MKKAIAILTMLGCAIALILPIRQSLAQSHQDSPPVSVRTDTTNACQALLTRAVTSMQSACDGLSRNQACYGNYRVNAELNDGAQVQFSSVGDIARITDIRTLSTAPLDEASGIWGISLLKFQANLPDTLPGQNVTFLVFGDAHVDNLSGDMRSFYFTSGLGLPSCKEVPKDSIVVKSPNHTKVTFEANGTQITIGSTILLRAVKGQQMTVALIEGHADVTTPQGSQSLKPGEQTTIQLGGDTGVVPVAAPSIPTAFTDLNDPATRYMIDLAQQLSGEDSPVTGSATGDSPVTSQEGQSSSVGGSGNGDFSNDLTLTPFATFTPSKVVPPTKAPYPTKVSPPTRVPKPTKAPEPTKAPPPTKVPPPPKKRP